MSIEPDTKDWTWVLERPCPECGFDAPGAGPRPRPGAIRDNATLWEVVLGTDDAAVRPVAAPLVAARVRLPRPRRQPALRRAGPPDAGRGQPHLRQLGPGPDRRRRRLRRAGSGRGRRRGRRGRRRGRGDLRRRVRRPVAAHRHPQQRRRLHRRHPRPLPPARPGPPRPRRLPRHQAGHGRVLRRLRRRLPRRARSRCPTRCARRSSGSSRRLDAGARVLEVGSGPGRDARALEEAGLSVRRTDITPAFVRMLRADGFEADVRRPAHRRPRRPRRATRRTTACGPRRRCCTSGARTSRRVLRRLGRGHPCRRRAPPRAEGGRRRPVLHPRPRRRAAPLHVLARGAAARGARGRRLGGRRGRPVRRGCAARPGSTCGRRGGADEAHRVLGADGGGARAVVRPALGGPVRHR